MRIEVFKHQDLATTRLKAKEEIDAAAEAARTRYITPGSGQVLEYEAAYREAVDYAAGLSGTYSMLQADVDAGLAADLAAAAATVILTRQQWEEIGSVIRRIRLQAKAAVDAEPTSEEVVKIRIRTVAQLGAI
jgi:hypothetical protein